MESFVPFAMVMLPISELWCLTGGIDPISYGPAETRTADVDVRCGGAGERRLAYRAAFSMVPLRNHALQRWNDPSSAKNTLAILV